MGGKCGKKRTVIALKTDNTFSRHDKVRRVKEDVSSRVSLNSLGAEKTHPDSPRLVPKRTNMKAEASACSESVSRVDVSTDQRRTLYPNKRARLKDPNRRSVVIAAAPLAAPAKSVGFSQQMVIENFRKDDDPYDKLEKIQFNRRPSSTLEHLEARTGSLKLLRRGNRRRRSSESEEEDTIAKIVHGAREVKPDHRRATVLSSAKEEGLRYSEGLHQHKAEGHKGRSTTYRLTHRRTISQKIIQPAQEANWSAFNSKRAERVWQWKGAYGSLAKRVS
jgi:hypothetical protein